MHIPVLFRHYLITWAYFIVKLTNVPAMNQAKEQYGEGGYSLISPNFSLQLSDLC